jgi:hypothetical protein
MTEQPNTQPRIFKIGTITIVEDESLAGKHPEAVRDILKTSYPEVAHATIRERQDPESGQHIVEFLARPGRKG